MLRKTRRSSNRQLLGLLCSVLATSTGACATGSSGEVIVHNAADGVSTGTIGNEIDRDEMAQMDDSSIRVGDMLRQFPSLRVRDYGGYICVAFSRAASKRSAGTTRCPSQVALVVDGVLMADPESYLPTLRPQALERVQFLQPSAATTRFGANGGNGALLIFTRSPGR